MKKPFFLAALISFFPFLVSAGCFDSVRWVGEDAISTSQTESGDNLYSAHQEILQLSGLAAETRRRDFLRLSVSKVASLGFDNIVDVARALRGGNALPLRDALLSIEMTAKSNELLTQLYWIHGCASEAHLLLEQGLEVRQRLGYREYSIPLAYGDTELLSKMIALDSVSDYVEARSVVLIALMNRTEDAPLVLAAFQNELVEFVKDTPNGFAKDYYGTLLASQYLGGQDIHLEETLSDLAKLEKDLALPAIAVIPVWLSAVGACEEALTISFSLLPETSFENVFLRQDVEAATLRCMALQERG